MAGQKKSPHERGRTPHVEIAAQIGISIPTLRKAFRDELAARLDAGASLFAAAGEALPEPTARPLPRTRPPTEGAGRPRYEPDEASRAKVSLLLAAGMPQADIARALGITEPTLRGAYVDELATGAARMRAQSLAMLYSSARKGNVSAQKAVHDIFARGAIAALDDEFRSKTDQAKAEPIGKKEQAALDAVATMTQDDEWSRVLQPIRH